MKKKLLIILIMTLSAFFTAATEDEEIEEARQQADTPAEQEDEDEEEEEEIVLPLEIMIQTDPAIPIAGSEWTLTLLVSHDKPNEVIVQAPRFTGDFDLQQVIKGPRFKTGDDESQSFSSVPQPVIEGRRTWQVADFERWTAVEYRFMMHSPGAFFFDSFTAVTPRGRISTNPFRIVVQEPSSAVTTTARRFQLNWAGTPSGLIVGESAEFRLTARNWNGALPDTARLTPKAPQGHILEPLPLSNDDIEAGAVLRLRVLAASPAPFALETYHVLYNNTEFVIPALLIPVSQAEIPPADTDAPTDDMPVTEPAPPPLPFPPAETAAAADARLYQKYTAEFEAVYRTAKELWENGNRAGALAILRKNERDHPAGKLFAPLRRETEKTLGFDGTNNEQRKNWLQKLLRFFRREKRLAVLKATDFRSIPDLASEALGCFSEGQPVVIAPANRMRKRTENAVPEKRETWLRIITNDSSGITGWVPSESVIFY